MWRDGRTAEDQDVLARQLSSGGDPFEVVERHFATDLCLGHLVEGFDGHPAVFPAVFIKHKASTGLQGRSHATDHFIREIALVVDEWGGWYDVEPGTNPGFLYQQNSMRDAMIAGTTLNIFHNHCDRVRIANLAQTVNVLQAVVLTEGDKMILTPTYHVMEMYNVHQDALLLPLDVRVNDYAFGVEKLPAVSASASRDKAEKVHISLVNIDPNKPQEVTISLRGVAATHHGDGRPQQQR